MILKLIQRLVVGDRISNMTVNEATRLGQSGELTIAETERLVKLHRMANGLRR